MIVVTGLCMALLLPCCALFLPMVLCLAALDCFQKCLTFDMCLPRLFTLAPPLSGMFSLRDLFCYLTCIRAQFEVFSFFLLDKPCLISGLAYFLVFFHLRASDSPPSQHISHALHTISDSGIHM